MLARPDVQHRRRAGRARPAALRISRSDEGGGGDIDGGIAGAQIGYSWQTGSWVFGVEGEAPPASAGVITQGNGNIQLYSQGSILLGQSRIMTTFGGSILGWSAEGDINAGRGSKSTAVYQPPRRVYDGYGNVTLSPPTQNTGAGIAPGYTDRITTVRPVPNSIIDVTMTGPNNFFNRLRRADFGVEHQQGPWRGTCCGRG